MSDCIAKRAAGFLRTARTGGTEVEESIAETLSSGIEAPVTGFEALGAEARRSIEGALAKLDRPEAMDAGEAFALEAIIIPDRRPAIDIANDDYRIEHRDWLHLNAPAVRDLLVPCIPAIGRLAVPEHPSLPYAGTAFLVGDGLIMTNRHVAEIFVDGLGGRGLRFRPGLSGEMNFVEEAGRAGEDSYEIDRALLVHPHWDLALLRVRGLPDGIAPLTLSRAGEAPAGPAPDVVVIGYPAFDPRNNADVQREVFGNRFNVKRLQPGKWLARREVGSFGNVVEAATHDSSTLGGNSGSAVIEVATGRVVALHFGGRYLDTNYAVPTGDLALDARLVDLGLNFERPELGFPGRAGAWTERWKELEGRDARREDAAPAKGQGSAPVPSAPDPAAPAASFTVPLVITVRAGSVAALAAGGTGGHRPGDAGAARLAEKPVEPWRDQTYRRTGYDPLFLGVEVPLPTPLDPDALASLQDGRRDIPYMHFSLAMDRKRRLALYTAANVRNDPAARDPDPSRGTTRRALGGLGENDREQWFADPRLRGTEQLPDRFFASDRKAFDKGHLVRRDDVAWGESYEEMRIANGDTYHVTNCSPQTAGFNRADGVQNWGELERAVLKQAAAQRLSVFAGPVLRDDDPLFNGVDEAGAIQVRIPRAYWKVVAAPDGNGLAAYAFLLEQDLGGVEWELAEALAFDPKWRAVALSLEALERRIGRLRFPDILHRSDRFGSEAVEAVADAAGIDRPKPAQDGGSAAPMEIELHVEPNG